MNKKIDEIISNEIEDFYSGNRTDDVSNVLDEIITELLDMNHGISYIPQGYVHNILDEEA